MTNLKQRGREIITASADHLGLGGWEQNVDGCSKPGSAESDPTASLRKHQPTVRMGLSLKIHKEQDRLYLVLKEFKAQQGRHRGKQCDGRPGGDPAASLTT